MDKMSIVSNSEVGSNGIINQIDIQDVKNIIANHGSPKLSNMFEELVRSYENSRLETSQNGNAGIENEEVVSRVST